MSFERLAGPLECSIGSKPGPYGDYPQDQLGVCLHRITHYEAIGTFTGFALVPEPATLALTLLALVALRAARGGRRR